jgi:hypothetical protein
MAMRALAETCKRLAALAALPVPTALAESPALAPHWLQNLASGLRLPPQEAQVVMVCLR